MGNISIDDKKELHVYAFYNILSQIGNLVSNWDKIRKTKMIYAQKIWLDPYMETWKTCLLIPCLGSYDLPNYL